jgi:hypothetical protein
MNRPICAAREDFVILTLNNPAAPPYRPPHLFTGYPTLDAVLTVWYGACDKSGPPAWEGLADLIWHPWFRNLMMAESWSRMKPARCEAGFPVAATLSNMVGVVSMRRRPVFLLLPARPGVGAGRLRVVGMPLAVTARAAASYRMERVLFAVVNQMADRGGQRIGTSADLAEVSGC